MEKKCGVVYKIQCGDCEEVYIGETSSRRSTGTFCHVILYHLNHVTKRPVSLVNIPRRNRKLVFQYKFSILKTKLFCLNLFIIIVIIIIIIKTICMQSIRKQHRARSVTCEPSET